VRRAPHSGSLSVNYRFLEDRANVNLFITFPATRRLLTSYNLVNLGGSYKVVDNIELYARVENLLDEKYEEIFGYRASGIGVYGGVRWAFNR
jgi:vitamin B12 transporter